MGRQPCAPVLFESRRVPGTKKNVTPVHYADRIQPMHATAGGGSDAEAISALEEVLQGSYGKNLLAKGSEGMDGKKSQAAIKRDIIEYLDRTSGQIDPRPGKYGCGIKHGTALVLATSYKDSPRATAVEFFNEGLTIYIFGEPGGKIANIKRNAAVSAFVYEPTDHLKIQQNLQIFAKAELITVRNNPRLFRAKLRKWGLYSAAQNMARSYIKAQKLSEKEGEAMIKKKTEALSLIRVVPYHIILKEKYPDFSTNKKYEWKK